VSDPVNNLPVNNLPVNNPYQPPQTLDQSLGSYGDHARLLKRGFLFRKIEFSQPFQGVLVYNGWNFLQRIIIDDIVVWKRISWVVIHRNAKFRLPPQLDPSERQCEMQITFSRGLRMKRFALLVAGEIVYDEWI
jgi:hypothetical protein